LDKIANFGNTKSRYSTPTFLLITYEINNSTQPR